MVAISLLAISLVETVGVCAILDGRGHDTATALMAWEVMGSIDWLALTPEPVVVLLSFSMGSVTVFASSIEGAARLLQDVKGLVPSTAPFSRCSLIV